MEWVCHWGGGNCFEDGEYLMLRGNVSFLAKLALEEDIIWLFVGDSLLILTLTHIELIVMHHLQKSLGNHQEHARFRCKWYLTHWGRVTHICVSKLTIIGSNNGLSPGRHQAIIWTNVGILFIEPLETNFSEILIVIQIFSFKKMRLKMSSAKWRPFFSASMC